MPKSLLQYTKERHALDVLVDNRMFLRLFSWLNDPFDGNFIHNVGLYLKEDMVVEVDESYNDKYQWPVLARTTILFQCGYLW